jgi:tetratricopeptide (TPR) repeat protein
VIESRSLAIPPAALVALSALLAACGGAAPERAARTEPRGKPAAAEPSATAGPAPAAPATPAAPAASDADRFHLGAHSRKVSTASPEAQAAFDRGLVLAYAFNHGAAERHFRQAAELDPRLAMAWWGVALVNGPHINNPAMSPEQVATAWEALGRARALADGGGALEQALIAATARRYVEDAGADRGPLDQAYADAMGEIWRGHPDDGDVGALYAEALMDLQPWNLWTVDGQAKPGTDAILATLESVLAVAPDHPLANHLYVHAVEGSPQPERGLAAADRLRDLVPGAGHLVHMPAHVDVRVGRWAEAVRANVNAIAADEAWRARFPEEPGFYRLYMAHDHQFLSFAEMMRGRGDSALKAARDMVAGIPEDWIAGPHGGFVDGVLPLPIEVLVRFGRWEDVLAEPESPGGLPISKVLRHFARATALTALGRLDEADAERATFRAGVAALPAEAIVGNNSAAAVMAVASRVIDGEIAARRESWEEAVAALREAAALEDALKYDDPPDWVQPARHALGAVLLDAGRPAEAEAAYRTDLGRWPENGWSLFGLEKALRAQGKAAEADAVGQRFRTAWADADVTIGASCLCRAPHPAG